jgi:hypothetical protein
MVRYATALLAPALVLTPTACQRAGPAAAPATPALEVVAREAADFPSGAKSTTWHLRGTGVKRLTARLAAFADGRPRGETRIDCAWDVPAGAVDGRLTLLVEDGGPFGAAGKRLKTLGLAFSAGAPTSRTEARADIPPADEPGGAQSLTTLNGPVDGRKVLYVEVRGPVGQIGLMESDDELARASAGSRSVLAVVLDWVPE